MKLTVPHIILYSLIGWLLIIALPLQAQDKDVLNNKMSFATLQGTVYQLLGRVSERSGYLFIYDSKTINNEQQTEISSGEYTLRQVIHLITGNKQLGMRIVGNHILLYPSQTTEQAPETIPETPADSIPYFTIEGTLSDQYTEKPIPFSSVGINEVAIGTITNQNGEFRLRLPDSLRQSTVQFSHLGYQPQKQTVDSLFGRHNLILLEPKVISLQEVIVRIINPHHLLQTMLSKRGINYPRHSVYLTTFYREGVEHKKNLVSLTEAVFKIHKSPREGAADQVKLLKMRRISNRQEKDTLITKMKSGINACLMLDLMKNLPDFLSSENDLSYAYAHTDITVIDNRLVNVISFEQKKGINTPLYRGELYIDTENEALLRAYFEINPQYIHKATDMLVEKKSRNLRITPSKVAYTVSYKAWNGTYYIQHIRGDLYFKIKKRTQLFNTTPLHTWFEMATCKTDTLHVSRFTRNETLPTRTVFSDTKFKYDESFWGNFNVILPEEKLNESLRKISSKIEETGY